MITLENKQDVRTVLAFFYGNTRAKTFRVNESVVKVVWQMLVEEKKCTAAINLVPRPVGTPPGLVYILKQIGRVAMQIKSDKLSETCARGVAYKMLPELQMASQGLKNPF